MGDYKMLDPESRPDLTPNFAPHSLCQLAYRVDMAKIAPRECDTHKSCRMACVEVITCLGCDAIVHLFDEHSNTCSCDARWSDTGKFEGYRFSEAYNF
jgi:hypothetical protein